MNKKKLTSFFIRASSASLLALSAYLFYNSFQLWFQCKTISDRFMTSYDNHQINLPVTMRQYESAVTDYQKFFGLYMTVGVASLIVATLLYVFSRPRGVTQPSQAQLGLLQRKQRWLLLASAVLLVLGSFGFYRALQLWYEYWQVAPIISPYCMAVNIAGFPKVEAYLTQFPLYLLIGVVSATCALALITVGFRRSLLTTASILIISSIILFWEAYNIQGMYQWAGQGFKPPVGYEEMVFVPAKLTYQTLFIPYILIGLVTIASGLILIIANRKTWLRI